MIEFQPFALPRLISENDSERVVEMTIVSPPFILDFASSYDELELLHLGFTDEVWAERETHWAEIFGPDWRVVRAARDELARVTELMILDLTPNNIRFALTDASSAPGAATLKRYFFRNTASVPAAMSFRAIVGAAPLKPILTAGRTARPWPGPVRGRAVPIPAAPAPWRPAHTPGPTSRFRPGHRH